MRKPKKRITKDDSVKFRIDPIEKNRLNSLIRLTRQKRGDIYRLSLYCYLKEFHPEILNETSDM